MTDSDPEDKEPLLEETGKSPYLPDLRDHGPLSIRARQSIGIQSRKSKISLALAPWEHNKTTKRQKKGE